MIRGPKNSHPSASSFVEKWLGSKEKKRVTERLNRSSIRHDRFDRDDYQGLIDEMREFQVSQDQLTDAAPVSGTNMFQDNFYTLLKAVPHQIDPQTMLPTHLINHSVMGHAMDLDEYEKLHRFSVADDISAAQAAIAMEPKLEEILDRLKAEQEAAEQLQEQMQEYMKLESDLKQAIQDLMDAEAEGEDGDDAEGEGEGQGEGEGEGEGQGSGQGGSGAGNPLAEGEFRDMQKNKALIEEQMRRLEQQMQETASAIDKGMDSKVTDNMASMRQAMNDAIQDAETTESACNAWGIDPGGLKAMPANERLALAEKLNSEKFRRIAELFGPMQRLALAEQSRKVYHAADEIFDIEQGKDLKRILVAELAKMTHPKLRALTLKRYIEGKLPQYKLQGVEKVAKGGIIFCEDGSGSMGGTREIWAKTIGLALARVAREQKRDFYGIHFGGTGELYEFDFQGFGPNAKIVTSSTHNRYPAGEYDYINGVVHFAEIFFGGGTDFVTPLSRALDIQTEQFNRKGRVDGDIVFVTDGYCGVGDEWLAKFKEEQARLNFRVWGIVIGGRADSEPLNTICDGRVFQINDLASGEEFREVFRNL